MQDSGTKRSNGEALLHSFWWVMVWPINVPLRLSVDSDGAESRPNWKMPQHEADRRAEASRLAHINWLSNLPEDFTCAEASAVWGVIPGVGGSSRISLLKNARKIQIKTDPETGKYLHRNGGRIYERTETFYKSLKKES